MRRTEQQRSTEQQLSSPSSAVLVLLLSFQEGVEPHQLGFSQAYMRQLIPTPLSPMHCVNLCRCFARTPAAACPR